MMFDQDAIDDMVQIEIIKAVANFAYKYGGQHNFQKQKLLFDLFNLKVPNNGYAKMRASEVFDEMVLKLPEQMLSRDIDYEDEFLSSWLTGLPTLLILAAEPFIQDGMPCWFVVYQLSSASCFYTVMTKYWEHRDPQCNFFELIYLQNERTTKSRPPGAKISNSCENCSANFWPHCYPIKSAL